MAKKNGCGDMVERRHSVSILSGLFMAILFAKKASVSTQPRT
jgi:hypothetical protein